MALTPFKRDAAATARKAHDEATRALATAETRRQKAATDVADAERAQAVAATADGDAAPDVLATATRQLRDARDLLTAYDERVIPAARQALAQAEAQVANAERETAYAAAEAKRKNATAKLTREYPDLAARYAELLATVREADAAIEAANANLPDGRDPLDTVEGVARDHPAQPARIVSDKVQGVWFHESGDRVMRTDRIRATGDSTGLYQEPPSSTVQMLGAQRVMKRDRRVVTTIPATPRVTGPRLGADPLPPLRFDPPAEGEQVTEYLTVDRIEAAA